MLKGVGTIPQVLGKASRCIGVVIEHTVDVLIQCSNRDQPQQKRCCEVMVESNYVLSVINTLGYLS